MIAFALGRLSAEIQAKQIGFADPFAKKEEPLTPNQHGQYQSIIDQFESWNQELMNLPTRCCYVKVPGHKAAKITSLKMKEPNIDQQELASVLGEYKRRYQRSQQEAAAVLQKAEADRHALYGSFPIHDQNTAAAAEPGVLFQNPFGQQDKKKR